MKTQELHLLYVFDAIMTERSVTRAANRLAMTQPAVSNAISRMRHIWNDPLFVRKGRNIEPTSYALSLWDQVRDHMYALTNAVSATQFDPANSKRTFRIAVTDVIVEMVWRQLIQLLEREAPGVDIHAVPYTPEGSHSDLREAHVDLAVGFLNQHDHSLRSTWLFESRHVLAMREEHKLAGQQVSMEEFLEARHLMVSLSGDAHGVVDGYLDQKGLTRRIAATVNQFSIVPQVLRESNLIAAIPELISQDCGFVDGLWMSELPFEVEATSMYLIWHARHDRDPGVVWLRSHIEELLQQRWSEIMKYSPCGQRNVQVS
ncbi:LysR family transcriptional regulator [Marinobacter salinexigens]|uniref:LysR family transcriptional regulator n=1 Tax=Marinobacter salinexigens TaxID=2919747 RepID=A0A5B0VJ92_9GAMM|nr:LysR family transcriptional regulator [Marinobacter salinexigens]KAA1173991.1 LysR family transcriptional regulator [Marinobacter salinexigens]